MRSGGAQRAQERMEEGQGCRGPWGTGPSSRVPPPHPRPYSGARERRGRRVAGELAPAPGYTEEISLSLSLSACEPPPGLAYPRPPSCFSLSLPAERAPSPSPWAPGLSPEGWQGSVLSLDCLHTLPPAQCLRWPVSASSSPAPLSPSLGASVRTVSPALQRVAQAHQGQA